MNKKKLLLGISLIMVLVLSIGTLFLYKWKEVTLIKTNTPNNNLINDFNVDDYQDVKSYVKILTVTWISLNTEPFYIKTKFWDTEKIQMIDVSKMWDFKDKSIIKDIHQAYLASNIFPVWWSSRSWIKQVDPSTISENAKFFQDIMDEKKGTIKWKEYKTDLENNKSKTSKEISKLAFIYEVEWNFEKKKELCTLTKKCNEDVSVKISWTVKDQ